MEKVIQNFRDNGIGLHDEGLRLCEWKESWSILAVSEIERIIATRGDRISNIFHVGSTAVVGLRAKPILDLVGEVFTFNDFDEKKLQLTDLGYIGMGEHGIEGRRYFVLKDSQLVTYVHLHLFLKGDCRVNQYIDFCDYLRSSSDALIRYESFKLSLLADGEIERMQYSGRKNPIMTTLTREASVWAKNRQ